VHRKHTPCVFGWDAGTHQKLIRILRHPHKLMIGKALLKSLRDEVRLVVSEPAFVHHPHRLAEERCFSGPNHLFLQGPGDVRYSPSHVDHLRYRDVLP